MKICFLMTDYDSKLDSFVPRLLDEISTPYDDSASSSPKKLLRFRSVDTDESDSEYAKANKSRKYPHEIAMEYGHRALDMYEKVDLREVYRPQKKEKPESINPDNCPQKKKQPESITPDNCPQRKKLPKSKNPERQKIPRSQIGVSYGNLPDYVASLVKKMPSHRPFGRVRPGQIIKLTPKQQQYISFDTVCTPDFAMPGGRVRRDQNIKPTPKKEYMAFNTVYPTPEKLDMIFDALNRRHVALGESSSKWSPQDRRDAIFAAQLRLVLETVQGTGSHIFRYSKEMAQDLATAALSYMRKKGERLELVEPGLFEFGQIYVGYRAHFNFRAKRTDIPDAPVETYFAQLRIYNYNCKRTKVAVDCCVSLGRSDLLPCEPDNRGCQYCTKFVHHPVDGCVGMKWGFKRWSEELSRSVEI